MSNYYEQRYSLHVRDSELVERIEKIYTDNKRSYRKLNPLLVDLLYRGVESYESEKLNIKSSCTNGEIFNEIQRILKLLYRMISDKKIIDKDCYVSSAIQSKLLSRLFNFVINNALENGIPYSSFEKGLMDDLPEDLENEKDSLIKEFEESGNNT